jgi:hypothetical protein
MKFENGQQDNQSASIAVAACSVVREALCAATTANYHKGPAGTLSFCSGFKNVE